MSRNGCRSGGKDGEENESQGRRQGIRKKSVRLGGSLGQIGGDYKKSGGGKKSEKRRRQQRREGGGKSKNESTKPTLSREVTRRSGRRKTHGGAWHSGDVESLDYSHIGGEDSGEAETRGKGTASSKRGRSQQPIKLRN